MSSRGYSSSLESPHWKNEKSFYCGKITCNNSYYPAHLSRVSMYKLYDKRSCCAAASPHRGNGGKVQTSTCLALHSLGQFNHGIIIVTTLQVINRVLNNSTNKKAVVGHFITLVIYSVSLYIVGTLLACNCLVRGDKMTTNFINRK
jgi:hypothetical protein